MRIRSSHIAVLVFISLVLTFTPPVFAQENQETGVVTLVGKLEWPGGALLDVWGYVDEDTGREYALVGHTYPDGLSIVDTTDPAHPVEVATVPNVRSGDVKTWKHYAYTADDTGGAVIDLSDPANPQVVGESVPAHNLFIDDRGFLYRSSPGLHLFDLNPDPTNPTLVWEAPVRPGDEGGSHDTAVVGERLYDFHRGRTNIYDVADPTDPQYLGAIEAPTVQLHHSGWPSQDGAYLFMCDEFAGSVAPDLTVWDVSQPDSPRQVASFDDPEAPIHNVYVIGDYAFASYYTAGFRVFDVSDPTAPRLVGAYDTTPQTGNGWYRGAFGAYPFTKSGHVYTSSLEHPNPSVSAEAKGTLHIFAVEGFTPATSTNTEAAPETPRTATLHANYPNPFNPETRITYTLATPSPVQLQVYDGLGRRMRTLVEATQPAGRYEVTWDGRDETGRGLPSGAYVLRLSTDGTTQARMLHLIK